MIESLFMQVANGTSAIIPGADPNLNQVAYIVTTVATSSGIIIGYLKTRAKADFGAMMGIIGVRKGTEAKEAVVKALTLEDKEELKAELLKKLKEEVMIGVKQEETQIAKKPEIDPSKLKDLPREKHETKPQI